jgi:23S rRNA (uracil1939-C5)-methyltransferase
MAVFLSLNNRKKRTLKSPTRSIRNRRPKSLRGGSKPNKVGRSIEFDIETMDSLGQGVAKIDGKPCFIPKTLPGEQGKATIVKTSKGVMFARLESVDVSADNRKEPVCEHFNQCPGCHYLHTDYPSELGYKQQALQHHLNRLSLSAPEMSIPNIIATPADRRLGYRNRMQLHYRHKYLGMIDSITDQVVEIPACQAIDKQLQPEFDALYRDRHWVKANKEKDSAKGHCELYLTKQGVSVEWDKPYAHGGFSQVNSDMNAVLKTAVCHAVDKECRSVLDLFSGDGNLSDPIVENSPSMARVMVDYAPDRVNNEVLNFVHLDLFSDSALRTFKARSELPQYDLLLVDPPRKGFPDLALWVKAFKPKKLIYVSCNAATMVRDLQQLTGKYSLDHIELLDLFPGTYHYETLVTVTFS